MDGDVVRVLYSIPLQENQSTGKESILQPGSEQPEHAKAPETSSSSRMGQDDDPGPSYVPGTLHHSILYLIWLYQLLGKCGKHVRRILNQRAVGVVLAPTIEGEMEHVKHFLPCIDACG